MDLKRLSSGLIGFLIVVFVLLFGNIYIISIVMSLISMLCMYEYIHAVSKKSSPLKLISYISCVIVLLTGIININLYKDILIYAIPIILFLLFFTVISSNLKKNFNDCVYTFFGIMYIVFFISFFVLIRRLEYGKILIWYPIFAAWGTDVFAYEVGKRIGKHKFTKVSPKKSIEGCVAGTISAIIIVLIYTYILNNYFNFNYSYLYISLIGFVLSIISQIGDLVASSIKRYVEIKDYSELIPGHGGMLDRIDSLLFILPFTYLLLQFI